MPSWSDALNLKRQKVMRMDLQLVVYGEQRGFGGGTCATEEDQVRLWTDQQLVCWCRGEFTSDVGETFIQAECRRRFHLPMYWTLDNIQRIVADQGALYQGPLYLTQVLDAFVQGTVARGVLHERLEHALLRVLDQPAPVFTQHWTALLDYIALHPTEFASSRFFTGLDNSRLTRLQQRQYTHLMQFVMEHSAVTQRAGVSQPRLDVLRLSGERLRRLQEYHQ